MKASAEIGMAKPRLAVALATVGGLGRLPLAPGTFGSAAGVGLAWLIARLTAAGINAPGINHRFLVTYALANVGIAGIGVWAASRCSEYMRHKDPPSIVIDEVSGQLISFAGQLAGVAALHWKSLLLGFILFRGFDIVKPFPARRAEWLRGGWGVMADDWVAGAYVAIILWLAYTLVPFQFS